jgi:hypothetical protein
MTKTFFAVMSLALAVSAHGERDVCAVTVTVNPESVVGAIKPMNAVNNGPIPSDFYSGQKRCNFVDYRAAHIPYARTHDANLAYEYGAPHVVDVSALFPDFDADENNPTNYDFVCTDHYLDGIRRAGTEVFFRLGQSIEHMPRKYGALPPKDFAKWARISEHIIRHYNEGWGWGADKTPTAVNVAWSNQFNIAYWEIWNEPDLDVSDNVPPKSPRCWGGTVTNFFEFYEIAAKHLKGKFPYLRIGGPASCGKEEWAVRFLSYCRAHEVPLDFFSWHTYTTDPFKVSAKAARIRKMMDDTGYAKSESILDEWNYVKGWGDDWIYSLEVQAGQFNQRGAAFFAAVMADCQNAPVDMLMYYDAGVSTTMNGLFDIVTLKPIKGYYPFLAWSKLASRGAQVACMVQEAVAGQFHAVAAKGEDGTLAVFVARYDRSGVATDTGGILVRISGCPLANARCHVTDSVRTFTEVPLVMQGDGSAIVTMEPDSFILVEL